MGRNGKKEPAFTRIIDFVNSHVGETVTSSEILLGKEPGKNAETTYLYKIVKLKYIEPIDDGFITQKDTMYKILKPFPEHYNSVMLNHEAKIRIGRIPDEHRYKVY